MADLTLRTVTDLTQVDAASWDALGHGGSPFLEHGFLRALERSRSVGRGSGWQPVYLLVEGPPPAAAGPPPLLGAVAAYIKTHSYGEYIFDWAWARGSAQAGISYYPKLVLAAPMTPATGPRLLSAPGAPREAVVDLLLAGARAVADAAGCASIHALFCTAEEQQELRARGYLPRASFQYHWRDGGYRSYDDFLAALTSRKRKQLRKERERALAQIDHVDWRSGDQLDPDDLAAIDRFYRRTTEDHGGADYLRPGFFAALAEEAPHRLRFARARRGDATVAGALFLETERALYGRYWGADLDAAFLHFELAYYAGIERCITRQIPLFEAGAQGEHKLLRGFLPAPTYSAHWLRHPGLHSAVARFVEEEAVAVARTMEQLHEASPYRAGGPDDASC